MDKPRVLISLCLLGAQCRYDGQCKPPLAELAETPITSVDVDTFALGVQAAQILIEQIEDPQTSLRQILLSTKLIERASTMREAQEETEAIHI